MEEKNLFITIVLCAGVMLVWSFIVVPHFKPATPPVDTTATTSAAPATASSASAPISASQTSSLIPGGASAILPEVTLEDSRNDIVFSAYGGSIKSWKLKLKGQLVDLVNHPDIAPLPLATFPETIFKIKTQGNQAIMEGTLPSGVQVFKTLQLNPNGFLNQYILRFKNPTGQPVDLKDWQWGWGPGLGTADSELKENARQMRALTLGPLAVHIIKEDAPQTFGTWAAIDNRYFLVAFIPPPGTIPTLAVTGKKDQTDLHLIQDTVVPAHGEVTLAYSLYAGPKGYTHLKNYGQRLEEAVDFGRFGPLGRLILRALYRLDELTGNYGWSIILLTIFLQICLSPLTLKSFKAAQAMKKLQPQIAALQAKYKGDPKRLNVEMMNIYKKTGTNPFGGCLPMIVQLPIFWALFTTLRNAYELRGSPFIFWIHDLSIADPHRILPIIMGGAMFAQQRMTAAITDPQQKQLMYMMPIMFTFMFMNFPAGLVLYWLTNNLLTMAFQGGYLYYTKEVPGTPDRPQVVK